MVGKPSVCVAVVIVAGCCTGQCLPEEIMQVLCAARVKDKGSRASVWHARLRSWKGGERGDRGVGGVLLCQREKA